MTIDARAILDELIALTRHLGEPQRDYAILGEGNTSATIDERRFWVTASGRSLDGIDATGFVEVRSDASRELLRRDGLGDDDVRAALVAMKCDGAPDPRPSVETVVHAVCLAQPGVRFVGHTHPTAVNMVTCSPEYERLLAGRIFPDEVVVCGPRPLLMPYVDPGLPLAQALERALAAFVAAHRGPPKVIYLRNHGVIALGASATEVRNITAMVVKVCRILVGAASLHPQGLVQFMADDDVQRIHHRADEHYRRRVLEGKR
ncbi:MAG: class II aldolase/adducin family protein [Phycisphaerales bacterium]